MEVVIYLKYQSTWEIDKTNKSYIRETMLTSISWLWFILLYIIVVGRYMYASAICIFPKLKCRKTVCISYRQANISSTKPGNKY